MDSTGYPNYRDSRDSYDAGRYSRDAQRGPRGWEETNYGQAYGGGDYASREGWAAPSDYSAPYTAYPPNQRQRGAYDESSEMWSAVSAPARPQRTGGGGRGGKSAPKRKGSPLKVAFGLLTTLALVAVIGLELGPKVYHLIVARGGGLGGPQTSATCASEATPPASQTPGAHASSATGPVTFATTAYTLAYPNGWQKSAQSGASAGLCDVVFLFSQPGGAARFNVEQAGAFAPLSDLQVIQAETQTAKQGGSTLTEITSAATTQTIGGEVWQRREYQVTTKGGVKLHLALLAGHHKGAGYAIVMLDSDTGFAGDDTTLFEPILHSLKFL